MRSAVVLVLRLLSTADAVVIAATLAMLWRPLPADPYPDLFTVLIPVPLVQILFRFFNVYGSHRLDGMQSLLRNILSAQICAFVLLALLLGVTGQSGRIPRLAAFSAVSTGILALGRWLMYGMLHRVRRRGGDARNVCVIGSWDRVQATAEMFDQHPAWGMRVSVAGIDGEQGRSFYTNPGRESAGDSLEATLQQNVIDEVLIAVPPERIAGERRTILLCEQYGILGRVLLEALPFAKTEPIEPVLPVAFEDARKSDAQLILKRLMDITMAGAATLLLIPLLILIAVLVKLSSAGPAIYRQTRAGLNGRKFTMYKFRTMVDGAESMLRPANRSITRGPAFKDPQDYRITSIGHILRRYSLDELPQLLNVLKGDMSLVGPRPLPICEAAAITGAHRRRFSVLPGLTGIWQVNGRSNVDFNSWMEYDLQYVDRWSVGLDAKLLLKTIPAVFNGRGAY